MKSAEEIAVIHNGPAVGIKKGQVVQVIDKERSFHGKQGLVLCVDMPHPEGATVAVFFFGEVKAYEFNRYEPDLDEWDRVHLSRLNKGDYSDLFWVDLFGTDDFENSPRVLRFKPEELAAKEWWGSSVMAERLFPNRWHSCYELPKDLPESPQSYNCLIEGCGDAAHTMAYANIWGSVYPLPVCRAHYRKYNRMCADSLPKMKDFKACVKK